MKRNTISLLLVTVLMLTLVSSTAFALPDDSILSQNIKEADGTTGQDTNSGSGIKTGHIQDGAITTPKIVDGAVSTSKIADGAVTDAKITGPISGSKLGTHTHSGSDIADGSVTTSKIAAGAITPDKVGFYNNVIIVAPSGGDFTSPVDAMNSISDASESNPYLVKIMPGVYNVGSSSVQMKPYVDIEGSGENATKIIGNSGDSSSGVIICATNAEIRLLTIENSGSGNYSQAIYINNVSNVKLSNVTVTSSTAVIKSTGIYNRQSSPLLTNVTIISSGPSTYVTGITDDSGSPVLKNVSINVSNGGDVYGMELNSSLNPSINNLKISASGGSSRTFGIANLYTSSTTIQNADITSTGASGNILGVWNAANSSLTIINANVNALRGILNQDNSFLRIINSMIKTTYSSIETSNTIQTYASYTMVDGNPAVSGNDKCIGLYDGNFDPYTCP